MTSLACIRKSVSHDRTKGLRLVFEIVFTATNLAGIDRTFTANKN